MTLAWGRQPVAAEVAHRVDQAEYARVLGYPQRREIAAAAAALAARSRSWYAEHGRPWVFLRRCDLAAVGAETIELVSSEVLTSPVLAERWRHAGATALAIAAVSAGAEVDERSEELWSQERPDEAYFLDRFGVAVAEHLAFWTGQRIRQLARDEKSAALPGYSPGYEGWTLEDQPRLARILEGPDPQGLPGPFEVLASGMIRPKSSLQAVFGLAPRTEIADEAWERHRCSWCSLPRCSFRRSSPPREG